MMLNITIKVIKGTQNGDGLGMVNPYNFCDVFPADGASVSAIKKWLGTLIAGDHVVTGAQQAVTLTIHTDGTVTVIVT